MSYSNNPLSPVRTTLGEQSVPSPSSHNNNNPHQQQHTPSYVGGSHPVPAARHRAHSPNQAVYQWASGIEAASTPNRHRSKVWGLSTMSPAQMASRPSNAPTQSWSSADPELAAQRLRTSPVRTYSENNSPKHVQHSSVVSSPSHDISTAATETSAARHTDPNYINAISSTPSNDTNTINTNTDTFVSPISKPTASSAHDTTTQKNLSPEQQHQQEEYQQQQLPHLLEYVLKQSAASSRNVAHHITEKEEVLEKEVQKYKQRHQLQQVRILELERDNKTLRETFQKETLSRQQYASRCEILLESVGTTPATRAAGSVLASAAASNKNLKLQTEQLQKDLALVQGMFQQEKMLKQQLDKRIAINNEEAINYASTSVNGSLFNLNKAFKHTQAASLNSTTGGPETVSQSGNNNISNNNNTNTTTMEFSSSSSSSIGGAGGKAIATKKDVDTLRQMYSEQILMRQELDTRMKIVFEENISRSSFFASSVSKLVVPSSSTSSSAAKKDVDTLRQMYSQQVISKQETDNRMKIIIEETTDRSSLSVGAPKNIAAASITSSSATKKDVDTLRQMYSQQVISKQETDIRMKIILEETTDRSSLFGAAPKNIVVSAATAGNNNTTASKDVDTLRQMYSQQVISKQETDNRMKIILEETTDRSSLSVGAPKNIAAASITSSSATKKDVDTLRQMYSQQVISKQETDIRMKIILEETTDRSSLFVAAPKNIVVVSSSATATAASAPSITNNDNNKREQDNNEESVRVLRTMFQQQTLLKAETEKRSSIASEEAIMIHSVPRPPRVDSSSDDVATLRTMFQQQTLLKAESDTRSSIIVQETNLYNNLPFPSRRDIAAAGVAATEKVIGKNKKDVDMFRQLFVGESFLRREADARNNISLDFYKTYPQISSKVAVVGAIAVTTAFTPSITVSSSAPKTSSSSNNNRDSTILRQSFVVENFIRREAEDRVRIMLQALGDDLKQSAATAPTDIATSTYKACARSLFAKYDPSQLGQIEALFKKNAGKEKAFVQDLAKKYSSSSSSSNNVAVVGTAQPYKVMVEAILKKHAPHELPNVNDMMKQHVGKEKQLVASLIAKYTNVVPTTSSTSPYKVAVESILMKHAPHQVGNVDAMLMQYQGRENELLTSLKSKYNVGSSSNASRDSSMLRNSFVHESLFHREAGARSAVQADYYSTLPRPSVSGKVVDSSASSSPVSSPTASAAVAASSPTTSQMKRDVETFRELFVGESFLRRESDSRNNISLDFYKTYPQISVADLAVSSRPASRVVSKPMPSSSSSGKDIIFLKNTFVVESFMRRESEARSTIMLEALTTNISISSSSSSNAATDAAVSVYKILARSLFKKHDRSQLGQIEALFKKNAGKEKAFVQDLAKKYSSSSSSVAVVGTAQPYKVMVEAILKKHAPHELPNVNDMMKQHVGKEKQLVASLIAKYTNVVPTTSATSPYKVAVESILMKHAPHQVGNVDAMLMQYQGRENELLTSLKSKYNVGSSSNASRDSSMLRNSFVHESLFHREAGARSAVQADYYSTLPRPSVSGKVVVDSSSSSPVSSPTASASAAAAASSPTTSQMKRDVETFRELFVGESFLRREADSRNNISLDFYKTYPQISSKVAVVGAIAVTTAFTPSITVSSSAPKTSSSSNNNRDSTVLRQSFVVENFIRREAEDRVRIMLQALGDDLKQSAATAPTDIATSTYKACARSLFAKYDPSQLGQIEALFKKNAGKEKAFVQDLAKKYSSSSSSVAVVGTAQPYKVMVEAILKKHAHHELPNVNDMMKQHVGKEKQLVASLIAKYTNVVPTTSATSPYKVAVESILMKHAPHQVGNVDAMLMQYQGRENELLTSLKSKYNVGSSSNASRDSSMLRNSFVHESLFHREAGARSAVQADYYSTLPRPSVSGKVVVSSASSSPVSSPTASASAAAAASSPTTSQMKRDVETFRELFVGESFLRRESDSRNNISLDFYKAYPQISASSSTQQPRASSSSPAPKRTTTTSTTTTGSVDHKEDLHFLRNSYVVQTFMLKESDARAKILLEVIGDNLEDERSTLRYRRILTALLKKHAPSELTNVDSLLAANRGKEQALISTLVKKYSQNKSPASSPTTSSPTSPTPTSPSNVYKTLITGLFKKYDPSRVATVDKLLAENVGKEKELYQKLKASFAS